ncbi:MAG: OmpA family protein [Bacteroidales bacterium]
MKIVFRHLLFSLFFLVTLPLSTQSKDFSVSSSRSSFFSVKWFKERSLSASLEKGNRYLNAGKYEDAIKQYKQVVEKKKKGKNEAVELLAEVYVFLGNNKEAMKWYDLALKHPTPTPETLLKSAFFLRDNGKYSEAKSVLGRYAQVVPTEAEKTRGLISNIDEIIKIEADTTYKPAILEVLDAEALSSPFNETAIAVSGEMLILTSNRPSRYRPKKVLRTQKGATQAKNKSTISAETPWVSKMWQLNLKKQRGEWQFGTITPFVPVPKIKIKDPIAQGPVSLTPDGKMVVFAQQYIDPVTKITGLELYLSTKQKNTWTKPIPFEFNSKVYSLKDPFISSDGLTLYFASDMPDGYGGFDIYKSKFANGKWGKPENLGATINTPYTDVSPLIFNDTTLYFSSDGHPTFGGLDIFKSDLKDGKWQKPQNMRAPINSTGNDVSFAPLSTTTIMPAVFISSRDGGVSNVFMYGSLKDLPLPAVDSVMPNKKSDLLKDSVSLPSSSYVAAAPIQSTPPLRGKVTQYASGVEALEYDTKAMTKTLSIPQKTEKGQAPKVGRPAKSEGVHAGNKFGTIYFQAGIPYVDKISYKAVADLIKLLKKDPSLRVHLDVYSDVLGTHAAKQRLTERRAIVLSDYLQQNGISAKRITTAAHGDLILVNRCSAGVNCSPQEHALNRRAEVKIIYPTDNPDIPSNSHQKTEVSKNNASPKVSTPSTQPGVKKDSRLKSLVFDINVPMTAFKSMETLAQVVETLNNKPTAVAEFSLHTDAAHGAGIASQVVLAQAMALLEYLKQQGVASHQINLRLFGCEKPLNRCTIGVACSPAEHAVNRRADVVIR